ncbi:Nucleolar protein [Actinidia chinensis var. chinensis]|uniref:Nucleolar protein 16 n=1 Tax=Actinidia chinensis var. chinensis TaxID=1590841 RepID=A0A2R6QDM5_ACTCC|nr:Nucleolar protein [Actinidia chinensis var. chinensis]
MGRSRRKYRKSRQKVQVGLPKKNPRVFKPSFSLPPKFRSIVESSDLKWDDKGSVIENYKSFGVVSNPNLLGVRSRTNHIIEIGSLQVPPPPPTPDAAGAEFESDDSGSDLEEDDLKSALGKKRRDGKSAPLQPLTNLQRIHIGKLVEKHGDDYQSMFMDTKLNKLQHSAGTLEKLCKRYHMYKDKNPLIVGC